MKSKLKIMSTAIALSAVGISSATSITLLNNGSLTKDKSQIVNSSTQSDTTDDLIPAQANGQNANISTSSGPVTYFNNTITALDWYGNKLWEKNMADEVKPNGTGSDAGKYLGSWRRAWYNWDYNRKQNILWILGYAYNSEQKIFGIDAATGNIKYEQSLGRKNGPTGTTNQPYKFITALSSGKVLAYGDPVAGFNGEGTIYDPETKTINTFKGNSVNQVPTSEESSYSGKYKWYFFNLIPIANNINIAEIVTFDNKSTGTQGDGSASNASYNVYGLLVDDELNFIGGNQKSGSNFSKPFKIAAGIQNYRNTSITPQRDYYTLLNNKTVTVTYNNVSVIDTSDTNNIKITQVKMTDSKWIQTWTVDANDNLYFKFLSDGKVYRISGDNLKSNQTSFAPSTYLDLSGVNNDDVKNNANNFLIYNVYGYTGELMMINAKYYNYINNYDKENAEISKDDNTTKLYGLAIAVVPNTADNNSGDLKGLLNTSNSFQKPADFTINDSTLTSKIPSEITKQDIELMNGAFFKDGDKKPFIISNINDQNGTFEVTANLYKIPWFASTLPDDSTPKVVTYTFGGSSSLKAAKKIEEKVSWKKLNSSTDYDFMNTLPSKITVDDVKNLDPFQPSFQSQTITNADGTQLYPKNTYTTSDANDEDGTIDVTVTYQYVPMSASYTNGTDTPYEFGGKNITEQQVLTYTATQKYNVFKSSESSAFWFTGATQASSDNQNISIDITKVPQLKNLLTANTLPSSFDYLNSQSDSSNSAFLSFINTSSSKGYPISKMKFKVESDDTNGTLKIKATMPNNYSPDSNDHTYIVTYTGLNKVSSYSFGFLNSVSTIDGTNINTLLPSSVDEGNILKNFITYEGYDSNDFDIKLTPNDTNGTLLVQVNLNENYANSIGSEDHGFTNYVATKTFSGFMTTTEYNNRFSVEFVGDDDSSLSDLKGRQAQEIITAFGEDGSQSKGLTVNNKTYTNLKDFVENVLVKTKGNSIPKDWKDNSNIKINVYVDNNLGMASFYIVIPKDQMNGATSDLNLVVTYSGFAKGNVDSTTDNFSFVSDKMLKNYLISQGKITSETWDSFTPDTFSKWLETNIKDLVSYQTGEYVTKLSKNEFTITTVANDIQGTVTVTINFGTMTNNKSLSEYSIQYTL